MPSVSQGISLPQKGFLISGRPQDLPPVPLLPAQKAVVSLKAPSHEPVFGEFDGRVKRAGKIQIFGKGGSVSRLPNGEAITALHVVLGVLGFHKAPAEIQFQIFKQLKNAGAIRLASSMIHNAGWGIDAAVVLTKKFQAFARPEVQISDLNPTLPTVKAAKAPPYPPGQLSQNGSRPSSSPELQKFATFLATLKVHGVISGAGSIDLPLIYGDSGAQYVDPKGNAVYTFVGSKGDESFLMPNSTEEKHSYLLVWNHRTSTWRVVDFPSLR